jgi:crotonobetainyl-CoA:carnitine CoA-transferase CaiB-like acyl-CoA transferase
VTSSRSADLLGGVGPFTVVGDGQAAGMAAQILETLGGSVQRLTEPIGQIGIGTLADRPVVICDLVSDGCDWSYVEEVSRRTNGVWITISAFGLDGPLGGKPGSDLMCAAAGGVLNAVSDPDGRIYPMPGSQSLKVAGQAAALAGLQGVSLLADGSGPVHLDLSVQEAVAFCSVQQECAHLVYDCGGIAGASRYSAPSGVFTCADGQIGVIVIDDHQWERVSAAMERPEWPQQYPRVADRVEAADEINGAVEEWTARRSKFLCERLMQEKGVAAVAIRTLAEVADTEQFRTRRFLLASPDSTLQTEPLPALVETGGTPRPLGGRRTLQDLRVAELTNVLAGPLAGAILGAIGATVVRLEDEGRLDIYRRNGPFQSGQAGQERAAYYLFANYCKRSITERIGKDKDYGRRVGDWADAVLENVGQRRIDRTGVAGPEDMARQGKSFLSISGFGRTGPCADYKAYAPNVHAFAGLAGAVIELSSPEAAIRTSFADYCAAIWAATLLSAWWLGGTPARVFDLSMAEVITSKLAGCPTAPAPSVDETAEVADLLVRCGDGGHVALVNRPPVNRSLLLGSLGVDEGSFGRGRAAGVEVWDISSEGPDTREVLERAEKAGIPATVGKGSAGLLEDEQLRSRGFLVRLPHPELGTATFFGLPWKVAGEERSGYRRPPLLGEDDQWMEAQLAEETWHRGRSKEGIA